MLVKYKKAICGGFWFYYSIGNLGYAVVYPSKSAFLKSKGYKKQDINFKRLEG